MNSIVFRCEQNGKPIPGLPALRRLIPAKVGTRAYKRRMAAVMAKARTARVGTVDEIRERRVTAIRLIDSLGIPKPYTQRQISAGVGCLFRASNEDREPTTDEFHEAVMNATKRPTTQTAD